jgi:4-alpha-glucanotransferase
MKRAGGMLLHIPSLPGREGIGTLGEEAFHFVDFLKEAGIQWWQILPLGPPVKENSPYLCYSVFAGNPLLISVTEAQKLGFEEPEELNARSQFKKAHVEFEKVKAWKYPLLRKLFADFQSGEHVFLKKDYQRFLDEHKGWLQDYTLFMALKDRFRNVPWNEWEEPLKRRDPKVLKEYSRQLSEEREFHAFLQFLFFRQWVSLKTYANQQGIQILGDMPYYVAGASVDVWTNPDVFLLDETLKPTHVGGVPPDYFSPTGQLWGNPLYNWKRLKERNFDWWMTRLLFNLRLYNRVRIDHFRGLESFWSVKADRQTAEDGEWIPVPGFDMLKKLKQQIGSLPILAEDLGVITPEVEKLREAFNLPGMKVLQFAFFSDETNPYLPHNYTRNFVVYTGTHDNDTSKGWYQSITRKEKTNLRKYFRGRKNQIAAWMMETAWASVAFLAIVPVQDLLGLDSRGRMNRPGTDSENWKWRLKPGQIRKKHIRYLKKLGVKYNRR